MPSFSPDPLQPASGFRPDPLSAGLDSGGSFVSEEAGAHGAAIKAPEPTIEEIQREAFEAGRTAAQAELPWREADLLRSATTAVEEIGRGLSALTRTYLVGQRRALIDLAIAIAERVLGRAVEADADALSENLSRALEALDERSATQVRISPRDLESLRQGLCPDLARLAEEHGLELEADPTLSPGDVRVLAGTTEVDARLSELLRRVREELVDCIETEARSE